VKRRAFITLLGAAAAWPLAARAQQPAKRPIVGFLGDSTPLAESERAAAFARRLHDLGWIEGRTIAIEYRWAEIVAEFARLKVDIIVTGGTPAVMAAKQAAPVVPIVFAAWGTGRRRHRRESGATGRQRHRPVITDGRSCWQTTRTLARGCPKSPPVGNHGQRR
jgi:hypothetical protein